MTPDGSAIAFRVNNDVSVWDIDSLASVAEISCDRIWNVATDGLGDTERLARHALTVIDKQLERLRDGAKRCEAPTAYLKRRES